MSKVMLAAEFSFLQQIQEENAICLILRISIKAKIKMIESLQLDKSLCSIEHQSNGVQRKNM